MSEQAKYTAMQLLRGYMGLPNTHSDLDVILMTIYAIEDLRVESASRSGGQNK